MNRFLFPAVVLCYSPTSCRRLVATLGLLIFACAIAQAQEAEIAIPEPLETVNAFEASQTNDTIGVTALRRLNPNLNGSGVRVAQPEGPYEVTNRFEVRPGYVAQPQIFTYVNSSGQTSNVFPNTVGTESLHANIVGAAFYGKTNGSNPEGVAYGVSHIDNYDAGYFYSPLISNTQSPPIAAKVANQSFIFTGSQNPTIDRQWDNYVATRNTIFASGVGNGNPNFNNGRPSNPATAYNVIAVGAFGGASSVGPTVDNGRSKPDITAPASETSYSTPLVAGAAAILVQAAGTMANANDPRTVKALLLNGAIKPLYQPNAADRWTHTETAPLDTRYGAGILNVYNSYRQFQGDRHSYIVQNTSTIPPVTGGNVPVRAGWDFQNSFSVGKVNHYFFDLTGGPGDSFTATATLVWNRQQNKTAINNLDLFLYGADGTLFASSASTVDNVEHLFLQALPPGRYDLEVKRNSGTAGGNDEKYALAFNFAPMQLTGAVSRKTHDGAGSFDIPLPLTGAAGIECRTGGANGDHQIVFSFAVPVTLNTNSAEVTSGTGAVSNTSGSGTNTITVNLTGVANAQTITLTLFGVEDGTNMTDVGVSMGVLLADVNASRRVDGGDVLLVRQNNLQSADSANFRTDINASGRIDGGDVLIARQQSLTSLP